MVDIQAMPGRVRGGDLLARPDRGRAADAGGCPERGAGLNVIYRRRGRHLVKVDSRVDRLVLRQRAGHRAIDGHMEIEVIDLCDRIGEGDINGRGAGLVGWKVTEGY